jgi:hypothetical protein
MLRYLYSDIHCCRSYIKISTVAVLIPRYLLWLYLFLDIHCRHSYTSISALVVVIWDEVPTMVEIAIFWFQIHITYGLNSLNRKWRIGNQYRVTAAEIRHALSRVVIPATLHSISVNAHFTRFLLNLETVKQMYLKLF